MHNIVGNVYDKYTSRNPIARLLMRGFLDGITELYNFLEPESVLEVGCGEGALANYLLRHSARRPLRFEASDLSLDLIKAESDPLIKFRESSIYELPYADNSFDLVLCSEVLEHLEDPRKGLAEIARVAEKGVLLSTPWEPVWRVMNLMRGKYVKALGNTPGHVQHFSRRGLIDLAQTHLSISKMRTPLPWTIIFGVP